MSHSKNIVLTDDHVIVRSGLKILIEKIGPYKVVAEFDNGSEFINAIPFENEPDLLILDLDMPVMSGQELVQWMKENDKTIPTLILTLNDDEELITRLFHLGVRGYLHKNCSSEMMKNAISQIIETGYYHNELLTKAILSPKQAGHSPTTQDLSEKEKEFLRLVCHPDEYTYDMISQIMKVGRRTVDNYREAIFEKYGIKSKTGMVMFAIKTGIVKV